MALKAVVVILDIEFPNGMLDEGYQGSNSGTREQTIGDEIGAIVSSGAVSQEFDSVKIDHAGRSAVADITFEVIAQ